MATAEPCAVRTMDEKFADCIITAGEKKEIAVRRASQEGVVVSDAKTQTDQSAANGIETHEKPFKVFIAVDPTAWSTYAFDWYLKNAHRPEYEVVCFHTMERQAVHGDEYCVSVETFEAVMKGCESNAQDMYNDYTWKMQNNKMNGRMMIHYSVMGPGETILSEALKQKANMIVVGTRGKGAVRRTLTGSVSDYVLHHAHCPVIVCCHERARRRSSRLSTSNSISEDIIE